VAEIAAGARPPTWHAYRALIGSRARSQTAYATSFALDVAGSAALVLVEFGEVYVIFHNVPVLGGLDLNAAVLVFALANLGFSIADIVCGQLDAIPTHLRAGTLDAVLLRPLPALAQLAAGDITVRRLGRTCLAAVLLAVALARADVEWTPSHVALLAITPLSGAAVFAGLFVAAGAAQFWLIDAEEVTSSFTYGAGYAASFSPAVLPLPVRVLFSFVVPAAFTAYLPTIAVLGLPGPPGLPAWLGWLAPVVAVLTWIAALSGWRAGLRRYTGAGG
jgi:ABC-2 type transport system permease protein